MLHTLTTIPSSTLLSSALSLIIHNVAFLPPFLFLPSCRFEDELEDVLQARSKRKQCKAEKVISPSLLKQHLSV